MAKKEMCLEDELISDLQVKLKKSTAHVSYIWESSTVVNEWVSTGSKLLDIVLSNRRNGGLPVGRLTEIAGMEGAGKSLIAAYVLANTQKMGGIAVLIDTEHATALDVVKAAGVDINKLIYVQASCTEDVFRSMEAITDKITASNTDKLITIVWDSVAATSSLAEIENDYADRTIAMNARLISQGLRKIIPIVSRNRICLVFVNQLRTNIGQSFGDKYTTTGGKAIPFHASIRLRVSNYQKIKDEAKKLVGRVVKCEVYKNKVAPPMREVFYAIRWGSKLGAWIDEDMTFLDTGEKEGIFTKETAQKYKFDPTPDKSYEFTKKKFSELMLTDAEFAAHVEDAFCDKFIITADNISAELTKEDSSDDE